MPKRKGTYASNSRRVYKRRRPFRRMARLAPVRRSRIGRAPITVHNFVRRDANSYTTTVLTGTNGVGAGQNFTFDSIVNATEFGGLYDQYKIWKIVVEFKLHTNPNSDYVTDGGATATLAPVTFPTLYVVNDHDDSSTPDLNTIRQYARTKRFVLAPNKIIRWSIRPTVLQLGYRTGVTSTYLPKYNQWVDMTNLDVPHYGMKFYIDNDNLVLGGQGLVVRREVKYYFSCKDVR